MATNPTPPTITEDSVYPDVDAALVWLYRMSMDTAADPGRAARSRMKLLMTGCRAWRDITEHRREWRLHDKLVAQLQVLKNMEAGK